MTTETTEKPVDQHNEDAVAFVQSHSIPAIIDELTNRAKTLDASKQANKDIRARLQQTVDTITSFIKEHYQDGATAEEMKELADELDIELTKTLSVSFTVKYECDVVVPLDYDEDSINDGMFDVSIEARFRDDEMELDHESTEVEDFDVTEA